MSPTAPLQAPRVGEAAFSIDRVRRLTDLRAKRELADLIDWQIESAIRACVFEPGRDPDGKPQETWLILTLHLSP